MARQVEDVGVPPPVESGEWAARILTVDDRPTSRAVLKSVFRPPRYEVREATGGREALDLLDAEPFDVVILDILMPDMNGLEVLRRIRSRFSESVLPVIMVTVKDASQDVVRGLELGANDYVVKPIDFAVLQARIRAQLSRKRAEEALREAHAALETRIAERTAELTEANHALLQEIQEREQAQRSARATEQRYRDLYDNTPSMFFTVSPKGTLLSVNRFGAEQLGFTVDELVGLPLTALHASEDHDSVEAHLSACLRSPDGLHRWEAWKLRQNGSRLWVRETARVVTGDDGTQNILIVCEDITEAYMLSEKLIYQASHDALTGLVNRREFEQRLQRVLETAWADNTESALCYLDLDQFKVINDTCSHLAGDELLRQLVTVLMGQVRSRDTIARLGGDEFGVLMEHCSLPQAQRVAESLRQAVERFQLRWEDRVFNTRVSIGVVPVSRSSEGIAGVLSAADSACYAAKEQGGNRVHVFQPDDAELARRYGEMEWVHRIGLALEENRLCLAAQPIMAVCAPAGEGERCELLLRMRDEAGQIVLPETFLPVAERYNLATRLDMWVVDRALTWLLSRLDEIELCTINLSGHSLGNPDYLAFVMRRLQDTGAPAHKICFEVTETTAIANIEAATHFMAALRERGCHFALDDFGSGLSSFAYLKNLQVDYLKIDGMFVRDIVVDPITRAMVRSINEIGQVTGKQTIAEFVESAEILEYLRAIGVQYAQGNYLGTPRLIED